MPEQDIQVFNSIPQTHGGNDDLQEGLLSLGNAAMDVVHHSAAQGVPSAVPYTLQDLAQIWDSNVSSLNDSLVDPVEAHSSAAFYARPAAMPMRSSSVEVPNPVYTDYAHHGYGEPSRSHSGSMSRTSLAQMPIDTFLMEHQTKVGAFPVSIIPSPPDLPVGPSRQRPRGMSHRMYTPHRLVAKKHNTASHRIECAHNLQFNPTWPIPPSGEMTNQNTVSEQGQFRGGEGSGVIPVEQTSERISGSRSARRSEPQEDQGNGKVAPKRGPRAGNRSAKRGGKPFVRQVRIDRVTGKPVYQGMRPDTKQQTEKAWDIAVGERGTTVG
ncbi:hypothetical protein JR316_0005498 [Psilocybe cubensis]|uniref:Uncharacterized protein n=2 Tax=Psilocybe cubensis TaxID=181762 RepID=A0ACB8H1A7_PSICU|nr:hypothetical protein JR316_0005498 [Psilocybe cubensis]KAH9480980.1 hypothetical protein JR316_0005498 [Psilocybe cubensis]